MRKFIWRVFYFALPILILAFPLDIFISKNLYRTGSQFGDLPENKKIHEGEINAEILIVGSSRAEEHFDTRIIQKELGQSVYNLGMGGGDWNLIRHRLEKYLEKNERPKYVIVNIDVGTFKIVDANYQVRIALLPYLLFDLHTYKVYSVPFEDVFLPLIRYIGKRNIIANTLNLWLNDEVIPSKKFNGFLPVEKAFHDPNIEALRNRDFSRLDIPPMELYRFFEENLPNSTVIGVHTPLLLESLEGVDLKDIRTPQFLDSFQKRNWIFLDYSESSISYDKTCFYNTLHMNKKGAENFTMILINDLRNYGIF